MDFNPCCQHPNIQKHQNANRNNWLQCEQCMHWLMLPATCSDSQAVALWNEDIKPSYEDLEAKGALLTRKLEVFEGIVSDSQGVAGYHQNGDIAVWDELLSDMESL